MEQEEIQKEWCLLRHRRERVTQPILRGGGCCRRTERGGLRCEHEKGFGKLLSMVLEGPRDISVKEKGGEVKTVSPEH